MSRQSGELRIFGIFCEWRQHTTKIFSNYNQAKTEANRLSKLPELADFPAARDIIKHELDHALADPITSGRISLSLITIGISKLNYTFATSQYSPIGKRTHDQLGAISLAHPNPSLWDFLITFTISR